MRKNSIIGKDMGYKNNNYNLISPLLEKKTLKLIEGKSQSHERNSVNGMLSARNSHDVISTIFMRKNKKKNSQNLLNKNSKIQINVRDKK